MLIEDLTSRIELAESKKNLREILEDICLLSSNERSNKEIILLLDKAMEKSELFNDEVSLVNLIGYKIPMLYNHRENISEVRKLILRMKSISEKNNYTDILSWAYSYSWYIEKFSGNKEKSKKYINHSMALLEKSAQTNEYISHFVKYSYAFEQWMEENDSQSAAIFEECASYFSREGFYRSLIQTLAVLFVIYQENQNRKSALKTTQKMLSDKIPFSNLPRDIQAISYYFVGLSHKLQLNLSLAEEYLEKAKKILKETLERSIYSFYYIPVLSHLSTVLALQGKMEQALELNKKVESLLKNKLFSNYFDPTSRRQIKHSYSLVKFYVKSRTNNYTNVEITELRENIYNNSKINYSNAIMLTEFLLSANLNSNQLIELKNTNNASLERVNHIINFLIEKAKFNNILDKKQHNQNCIKALQKDFKTKKMTFIEKAYVDLLIAQQLSLLKRFSEIYPLLNKYKNRRIEVLEMQIFMEAFIQVGKFKNGDTLAPAMHFMAIKRCKVQQFGRLERILLEQIRTLQNIAINSMKG